MFIIYDILFIIFAIISLPYLCIKKKWHGGFFMRFGIFSKALKNALKQRVKIEPIIGHLKSDHRMNRCRYKGAAGDTVNVVWATLAWNTKKITRLHRQKEEKQAQREMKRAA